MSAMGRTSAVESPNGGPATSLAVTDRTILCGSVELPMRIPGSYCGTSGGTAPQLVNDRFVSTRQCDPVGWGSALNRSSGYVELLVSPRESGMTDPDAAEWVPPRSAASLRAMNAQTSSAP